MGCSCAGAGSGVFGCARGGLAGATSGNSMSSRDGLPFL